MVELSRLEVVFLFFYMAFMAIISIPLMFFAGLWCVYEGLKIAVKGEAI